MLFIFSVYQNEKQKDKRDERDCVRDSSGKPGAVGNREDLERIARPEGARPKSPADECALHECLRRMSSTIAIDLKD